jgi:hypothetical protein
MDWMGQQLGVSSLEDWYKIDKEKVKTMEGYSFIRDVCKGSLARALMNAYPNEDWKPWLLGKVTKNYWNDIANQRKYFDWLAKELNVTSYVGKFY